MIERGAHRPQDASAPKTKDKLGKSINKKLNLHMMDAPFNDEKTLCEPATYGLRDARMARTPDIQLEQKNRKSFASNRANDEPYYCQKHGCTRRFINQSELSNHMAVMHGIADDPSSPPPVQSPLPLPLRPKPIERKFLLGDADDGDPEQTVRPPPRQVVASRDDDEDVHSEIARSVSAFSQMTMSDVMPASSTHSTYTDSMALEQDAALSDIAETESQEIQRPVRMLIYLWRRFVDRYTRAPTQGAKEHATYGQSEVQPAATRTSSTNLHRRSSSSVSTTSSSKRQRESDEDDEKNNKKQQKLDPKPDLTSSKDRPLACPFNKFNNLQFGEVNPAYHVCSTWNSVKTAYLKQHLQRNHCPPPHCCPRCQSVSKTAAELRDHQRQPVPCEVKELDKQKILPEYQEELGLRNRNQVGKDREEYWFQVFDTVFPGERPNREIDPYYRGPAHEVLERFLRFSALRLPVILARVRCELRIESDTTPERDVELCRSILQEANETFMAEMANAPPVDLRQLKKTSSNVSEIEDQRAEETVKVYDKKPQPEIVPSEEDFTQMGQSTDMGVRQPPTPASTGNQPPMQPITMPPQPATPAMPENSPPQTFQQDPTLDFGHYPYTVQDFEQLLNDSNFDNAIEDTDLYGAGDAAFNGWEDIGRHP